MITNKEIESITLSATKKDFYQIWNELLETAEKLSERWSPESTNEADPGIVLLKVLTAIADKLNYSIDKNTLECFMPSASQEESMRKLCDMLGYGMRYYRSATTDVTISYTGETALGTSVISIPAGTNVKNADDDANYFTLEDLTLNADITSKQVECMEGELVACGDDTDGIITLDQLDDARRYHLPESQIAENGIFVKNLDNSIAYKWDAVDNLNTQQVGKKCFKFGFDSKLSSPYIEFPEDISSIIGDGLTISYARTNGANGNVSRGALSKLEAPEAWSGDTTGILSADNFSVKNESAAINGANKESLDDAYNGYKKTIGTFDTLVTCRDYMNKIYQLTTTDAAKTPLVSNDIAADIRDDINRAVNICTFDEHGIAYVDKSRKDSGGDDRITHFDLVLYPFATISGSVTKDAYKRSFKYTATNKSEIEEGLEKYKTISHRFVYPDDDDIAVIKNYVRLKAKIMTVTKVNAAEEASILNNVFAAIYEKYNMRKMDFGEELPETVADTIQNADSRIKNVAMDEPTLYTVFCDANGDEIGNTASSYNSVYNSMAIRNVLSGRLPLFDYNEDFEPDYGEKAYGSGISPIYPPSGKTIARVEGSYDIASQNAEVALGENEIVQFRAPNFKTTLTYPAYVNYFYYAGAGASNTISANADYQLTGNEWLAINYTPSVTADDGTTTTGEPINVVYTSGQIIRPNFDLQDSVAYRQSHSPSKTSGYDQMPQTQKTVIDSGGSRSGMFTLSTTQQLELRDKVTVLLNDKVTNLYWERNDEASLLSADGKTVIFGWDEDPLTPGGTDYSSYTLKDGEYIYYTDSSKIDLAYYGNGTKITRSSASLVISKPRTDAEALAEKIASEGLLAGLPWTPYDLRSTTLTLAEYQYINLTAGDKLKNINGGATAIPFAISKSWSATDVTSATFRYGDGTADKQLPTISVPSTAWKVRSILSINSAPAAAQTLHSAGTSSATTAKDSIKLIYSDGTDSGEIAPAWDTSAYKALSFKTNYICQSAYGSVTVDSDITDFKLETFEKSDVGAISGGGQSVALTELNNFGDGHWTKVSFGDKSSFDLNVKLSGSDHALIMFYYIDQSTTLTNHAYLTLTNSVTPNICNAANGQATLISNGWWTGGTSGSSPVKYHLRSGVNVVEIPGSCTITATHDVNEKGIVIFSGFDAARISSGALKINDRIDYRAVTAATPAAQIMADIAAEDPNFEFYYNAVIDGSMAIDFNYNITDPSAEGYERLSTPNTWYDYNNANNKFVVSEIDADYLKTGITLMSSSRRQ